MVVVLCAAVLGFGFHALLRFSMHRQLTQRRYRIENQVRALEWISGVALLLALATSWVFTGGFRGACLVGLALPFLFFLHGAWMNERQTRALERASLAHWHALRGFIASGIGLPQALFQLGGSDDNAYARRMRKSLEKYEKGDSLHVCLERFRNRVPLKLTRVCLVALETAYTQGLPLVPFLDQILPVIEWEQEAEARLRDLRTSAIAQTAFAAVLPWGVLAATSWLAPELAMDFRGSDGMAFLGVGVLVLIWEGLGVVLLWRLCAFY